MKKLFLHLLLTCSWPLYAQLKVIAHMGASFEAPESHPIKNLTLSELHSLGLDGVITNNVRRMQKAFSAE